MKKRGIAYARFSSELQDDNSIEMQLQAIREWALKNDYEIVKEYVDAAISMDERTIAMDLTNYGMTSGTERLRRTRFCFTKCRAFFVTSCSGNFTRSAWIGSAFNASALPNRCQNITARRSLQDHDPRVRSIYIGEHWRAQP